MQSCPVEANNSTVRSSICSLYLRCGLCIHCVLYLASLLWSTRQVIKFRVEVSNYTV